MHNLLDANKVLVDVVNNFLVVVLPQYDLPYVIAPLPLAFLSMALWLLTKGVDCPLWEQSRRRRHLLEDDRAFGPNP